VIIRRFKKCCTSDEMEGRRMRKMLEMWAVNMRQDGNCEDIEAETGNGMVNRD
jgi:hypothetical protein